LKAYASLSFPGKLDRQEKCIFSTVPPVTLLNLTWFHVHFLLPFEAGVYSYSSRRSSKTG